MTRQRLVLMKPRVKALGLISALYRRTLRGQPCSEQPGATAARTGCIPAKQEGAQQHQQQTSTTNVKVEVLNDQAPEVVRSLFGQEANPNTVATAVGAPEGSTVVVTTHAGSNMLFVVVEHPWIKSCKRTFKRDKDGALYVHNDNFEVKEAYQGNGFGGDVFAKQVKECANLGVAYISTSAVRDIDMNGYYTWPRLGYDQPIEELVGDVKEKVQRFFPEAKSVLDIMRTKEGREWWKKYGKSMYDARFDLAEDSRSQIVLRDYLQEKGNK